MKRFTTTTTTTSDDDDDDDDDDDNDNEGNESAFVCVRTFFGVFPVNTGLV